MELLPYFWATSAHYWLAPSDFYCPAVFFWTSCTNHAPSRILQHHWAVSCWLLVTLPHSTASFCFLWTFRSHLSAKIPIVLRLGQWQTWTEWSSWVLCWFIDWHWDASISLPYPRVAKDAVGSRVGAWWCLDWKTLRLAGCSPKESLWCCGYCSVAFWADPGRVWVF